MSISVNKGITKHMYHIEIFACGVTSIIAGYVNGGDVVRMIHRHSGVDCLTVATRSSDSVCTNPSENEDEA